MEAKKLINLAEESFKHGKIDAAIKHAVEAMYCDPEVSTDTIAHLSAYMIHKAMSLEDKTWYKVLGVQEIGSDQITIKKQYKKMVLLVHPDKNKSVAAESAFKFVKEAWDVLSDPQKKKDYDFNLQRMSSSKRKVSPRSNNLVNNPFRCWFNVESESERSTKRQRRSSQIH